MAQEAGRTGRVAAQGGERSTEELQRGGEATPRGGRSPGEERTMSPGAPRSDVMAHTRGLATKDTLATMRETEEQVLAAWSRLHAGKTEPDAGLGKALIDCAEACRTASNFMMRGSRLHGVTCKMCEEVCEALAEVLDGKKDGEWENLLGQVRACAASCREMAQAMGVSISTGQRRAIEEETETVG